MLDRYAYCENDAAASALDVTSAIIGIGQDNPTSGKRGYLYDLLWGTSSTANDNQLRYVLNRYNAGSGGTAFAATSGVPTPLDASAPASLLLGFHTFTGLDVTAGELLLNVGANQRSTQRWVAAPGGEIQVPDTARNGLAFFAIHASATPVVEATMHFYE